MSESIPLEQGLRHPWSRAAQSPHNKSESIPLEQGLRLCDIKIFFGHTICQRVFH